MHRQLKPQTSTKRQSTLTQIDFVSTPKPRNEIIPNSSDEDAHGDDWSDSSALRPPKKRKTSSAPVDRSVSKGQSTLTQRWDSATTEYGPADASDDDFIPLISPERQSTRGSRGAKDDRSLSISSESESNTSKTPSDSRIVMNNDTNGRSTGKWLERNPCTPRKPKRREVPSSITPSGITLSVHHASHRDNEPICSPSPRWGLTAKQRKFEDDYEGLSEASVDACLVSPESECILRGEQKDPEADGLETAPPMRDMQSLAERSKKRCGGSGYERCLSRDTVIADSQQVPEFDGIADFDDEQEGCTIPPFCPRLRADDHSYTQLQQTYDPISAALDRDAGRFQPPELSHPDPHSPLGADFQPEEMFGRHKTETSRRHDLHTETSEFSRYSTNSQDVPEALLQQSNTAEQIEPTHRIRRTTIEAPDNTDTNEDKPLISYPIALDTASGHMRPSQVSTITSSPATQALQPVCGTVSSGRHEEETTAHEPVMSSYPSSPIPLPPWTKEERNARTNKETQSSEVADFSLPPPPSLGCKSKHIRSLDK